MDAAKAQQEQAAQSSRSVIFPGVSVLYLLQTWVALVVVSWGCYNKYDSQGGLNNRLLFSHDSGGWKSEGSISGGLL